jgi:hypothetical protein
MYCQLGYHTLHGSCHDNNCMIVPDIGRGTSLLGTLIISTTH